MKSEDLDGLTEKAMKEIYARPFTDDDFQLFNSLLLDLAMTGQSKVRFTHPHGKIEDFDLLALLNRLKAAELKECNQFHCGHPSCNEWRRLAGK